jgi:bifunctional DNase/RNase
MSRVTLSVLGLSTSQSQSGAYALILQEESGLARIPIIIGAFEAQSIAIALEGLAPPRPLTHDLFLNFSNAYNISLLEVEINKMEEGIFYARMIFKSSSGKVIMDARTSDAVALAIRFNAPIYMTKDVLEKAGIVLETETKKSKTTKPKTKQEQIKQIKKQLQTAIKKEDYEKAAQLNQKLSDLEASEES